MSNNLESRYRELKKSYSEGVMLAQTMLNQVNSIEDTSKRSHAASMVKNLLNECQKSADILAQAESVLNTNFDVSENEARSAAKQRLDKNGLSDVANKM